ncbi:hypothetical protein RHODO2019_18550 (plasmid) [Rhodococcus antarcticus]|uniref:Ribbon-helix-helix CopG family protein n=1 Tax=Rhodococcus antarcticus TaxID=2987751 RepID=A0ABY6P7B3_9NOCA|nr:hypothetical protein [Rhodococcus antarcticus]UZJ26993.1 hypothetical protein RHODO2019_18550 [Rhodococcus antarcticus]
MVVAYKAPAPVTARLASEADRVLLEAVAEHQGLTVSKLVARAIQDYIREYVREVGPDTIVRDNRATAEAREQSISRQMNSLMSDVPLAPPGANGHDQDPSVSAQARTGL